MVTYKGLISGSWIIFCLAVMPTVLSQTMLISSTQRVCPGATIIFTCTTTGSSILTWTSEEYIGSGSQLEFRSITDPVGTSRPSTTNPDTVANLTAISNDVLTSTLRIVTRSTTLSVTVSCINVALGETNTSIIPPAAVPGVPQNVRAVEISERIENNCILLVTWSPPASSDGSDIDHYIVYVPSQNIMSIESSVITVLRVPNCRDDDGIFVAVVNIFGCIGRNSSEVQPSLIFHDNAETTNGGSTMVTVTPIEDGTTSTPVVSAPVVSAPVIAVTILAIILLISNILAVVLFCVFYKKRGKKIQAGNEEAKQVRVALQDIQGDVIQHDLEELYHALKSQPDGKIRVAAKSLSKKLEKESSFNKIKEALMSCLEEMRSESSKDVQKALNTMYNIIIDMRSIDKEFEKYFLHLRTEAGKDKHEKALDDLIKKVGGEEVRPDKIIGILQKLCKKLRCLQQLHIEEYYEKQSKYDFCNLGTEKDRVRVPIWIHDTLDDSWKNSLHEAVQAINKAAPGLDLSLLETDKKGAIIHVLATNEDEAYTEGSILMRSIPENSDFIVKIYLGRKWKEERKKGTSIHELLHALGFHHERQCSDAHAPSYVYHLDSGNQITINGNWLGLTCFDPLSIMLYPCEKKTECKEHQEVSVWLLKADQAQENTELSELDKVCLNLVYPPCVDKTDDNVRYRPKLGQNGMYYCGRKAVCHHIYPHDNTVGFCEPDDGPNCPACRTILSPKVEMILKEKRCQGMTGLVYCGRQFTKPAQIIDTHDGKCGMDNGPACPDCECILKKEMDLS